MSLTPAILFRADGDFQMGLGHLFRSAALAEMLRGRFRCILVAKKVPQSIRERLGESFSEIISVSDTCTSPRQEAEWLIGKAAEKTAQIIILDGYHFKTDYQKLIHEHELKLVCIDDIHSCDFYADLIINHAPTLNLRRQYSDKVDTNYALGLHFALLRKLFLRAALRPKRGSRTRVVISFGGSDAKGITEKLIIELTRIGFTMPLDVVLGHASKHLEAVQVALKLYAGNTTIHHGLGDAALVELYESAKLAFLPASTTLIEALACGCTVIGGYYVDNQVDIYHGLLEKDLIYGIGDWEAPENLAAQIETALLKPKAERRLPDGFSHLNYLQLFSQLGAGLPVIVCRPVEDTDSRTLFDWINDDDVRRNSVNTEPVKWEGHQAWLKRKLKDENSLLLMFLLRGQPCGMIRFDLNREALVTISIGKEFRGQGIGKRILELGQEQLVQRFASVQRIFAYVRPGNLASRKLFLALGYTPGGQEKIENVLLDRFVNEI